MFAAFKVALLANRSLTGVLIISSCFLPSACTRPLSTSSLLTTDFTSGRPLQYRSRRALRQGFWFSRTFRRVRHRGRCVRRRCWFGREFGQRRLIVGSRSLFRERP